MKCSVNIWHQLTYIWYFVHICFCNTYTDVILFDKCMTHTLKTSLDPLPIPQKRAKMCKLCTKCTTWYLRDVHMLMCSFKRFLLGKYTVMPLSHVSPAVLFVHRVCPYHCMRLFTPVVHFKEATQGCFWHLGYFHQDTLLLTIIFVCNICVYQTHIFISLLFLLK